MKKEILTAERSEQIISRMEKTASEASIKMEAIHSLDVFQALREAWTAVLPVLTVFSLSQFIVLLGTPGRQGVYISVPDTLISVLSSFCSVGIQLTGLWMLLCLAITYGHRKGLKSETAALTAVAGYLIMAAAPTDGSGHLRINGCFFPGSMFLDVICAVLIIRVYSLLTSKEIKLNFSLPEKVIRSVTVLLPYAGTLSVCLLIRILTHGQLSDYFLNFCTPVLDQLDNVFIFSLDRFLAGIFWSLGLHWDGLTDIYVIPFMLERTAENALSAMNNAGGVLPYVWTYSLHNWASKPGYAWALIVLLRRSRCNELRMKGKEYTKPVFFSSYESLWFGVPVIMNRFLMPGLILSITGTGIATYLMLQYNVCSRCCVFVPWMVPGILAGFIQTGGDPRFLIVMAVNFVLGLLIWLPFVKRYEREMSIPYLS